MTVNRQVPLALALLVAQILLLPGCRPSVTLPAAATTAEPPTTTIPEVSMPLEGTTWTLASLRADEPMAGSSLTLAHYPGNYMEGTAGCNSYGVEYVTEDAAFHLEQIHRTHSECHEPPGIMQQDKAFFEALGSIAAYRASEERLLLYDGAGEMILVYLRRLPATIDPALKGTEWLLTSVFGADLLEGSPITLNLGGERFDGYAGCNNYGGRYENADEGRLLTSEIFLTAMDCPSRQDVMQQEKAYIEALGTSLTYRLSDGRLEIANTSGEEILRFEGKEQFDTDASDLLGTVWRLVSIDGDSLAEGASFTLAFYREYIVGGHAGCRNYLAT
jgi:heat shock protein HslJ